MEQQLPMQDKEMMNDVLSSEKSMTELYNTYTNECASSGIRHTMLTILNESHSMQADIFDDMQRRGWYQTTPAEQQKIQSVKQQYSAQ
ncbi:MAG: spore coat protein [Clostridia bacterium]|nr:spore coat protein [Clostridia bacterium]